MDVVKKKGTRRPMLEFFAGSGLVGYGLSQFFQPVWANDISEGKGAVYTANFGSDVFHLGDIRDISGQYLPEAQLSWASFPCQDLSLAGLRGGIHAARSGLVWEWLRILDETSIKPNILLLENVVGLLSSDGGQNYVTLHEALVERGYDAGAMVINADLFVPQSRSRVFILAVRHGLPIPSELVSFAPCWLHTSAVCRASRLVRNWIWWSTDRPEPRRTSLSDIIDDSVPYDMNHVLSLIPQKHLAKLAFQKEVCMTGYRRTRHGKQQLELRFDGVAGCLRTPEGGSSKQFLITKKNGELQARFLTVRETARLMGAPDTFRLPGSKHDGYMAMGDAVAVPVAEFLGERFLSKLADSIYGKYS